MEGWRKALKSKTVFVTVHVTVIVGVIISSLYVFSAINSSSYGSSSSFLSSPPLSNVGRFSAHSPSNLTSDFPIRAPPHDKKMPPLETFRLTKELVGGRAKDNIVIVTFGNFAFMDFILNWVKHLTCLGLSNVLIGALDTKLLEALYWKGIPVFDMGSHLSAADLGWGSASFHKLGREKVILIDAILPYGYELLMCDSDVVWLKNPLPYLARYPEADILTSTDEVVPTVVDDSLDIWQQVEADYNIGIFHWRPTESAKKLVKEWKDTLLADDQIWDQIGFNEIVRKRLGPSVDGDSGVFYAYDGNLKVGLLPASVFCSGHTFFVQGTYKQLRLEPYAVHTTFQYAGTEGKRHRLREAMVFYDPPQYYDAPGGFLAFKASIPKSMLLDGHHTLASHFALVNHQIKQIRSALAIASLLNRTLVMPPLWCRLDKLWFGHPGILEGSLTRQPFLCPLDHVFKIDTMLKELPEDEFGPGIGIREYSFFDNPLLPKHVKESWLDVKLCHEGCETSDNTISSGFIKFPKRSSEERFKATFSSLKDVKVINFYSVQDAFTGFSDKEREEKFRRRVKRYVGRWCCVENRTLGHIYYDMYWDEKPPPLL
ncbi:PREDICTED: arabinosyltransferase XEG113-like [Tarenaya hassleriana]|uniref:arabinosyltransferase XEG113-like n=1 Tax=Tarenaya hassleriana TaxID=28532 RepID=UPI00053C0BA9|nr:PREDICTED: arabinosyltransferase XEG113-like [Tarenaya hassleriana]